MNCCLQPLPGAAMVMVISMVALSMAFSSRDDLLSPLPLLQIGLAGGEGPLWNMDGDSQLPQHRADGILQLSALGIHGKDKVPALGPGAAVQLGSGGILVHLCLPVGESSGKVIDEIGQLLPKTSARRLCM